MGLPLPEAGGTQTALPTILFAALQGLYPLPQYVGFLIGQGQLDWQTP